MSVKGCEVVLRLLLPTNAISLHFQPAGGCITALAHAVGIDAVVRSAGLQATETVALNVVMRCDQFDSGRNMGR